VVNPAAVGCASHLVLELLGSKRQRSKCVSRHACRADDGTPRAAGQLDAYSCRRLPSIAFLADLDLDQVCPVIEFGEPVELLLRAAQEACSDSRVPGSDDDIHPKASRVNR
jgi:hypothetical protein